MKRSDFAGVVTALVTPFKRGRVDYKSLKRLIRYQMDGGVEGFVVNGTTAESPTLHEDEVEKIFRFVRTETDGAVPLILGTGSSSTAKTISNTKKAKRLKADGALVVVPYYNKPPQRCLLAHFTAVAKAVPMPILLYNVPGRTVISLSKDTILKLAKIKNIVGIKEASGQIDLVRELVNEKPKGFLLSSGDDGSCLEFMLNGGRGVVSVISHVIPQALRNLSDRALLGEITVRTEYEKYSGLNQLLGIESNPIPVKSMLHMMGHIDSPELRLPLMALEGENKNRVAQELKRLGLI